jgi:tetratricopeptide (TPR) repeat protein
LPESASPAARVERARLVGVLGRLDDAAALTEPLQDTDANAAQLLAVVRQKQKRYEESSVLYRKALAVLGEGPEAIANRVQAYDGLAFNARAMKRPGDAEAAYREAMTRLPAAAAHFHFQLGRHYQLGGRPANALQHLQQAAHLDPSRYAEQARPLIEELNRSTPGCFVGRPK